MKIAAGWPLGVNSVVSALLGVRSLIVVRDD